MYHTFTNENHLLIPQDAFDAMGYFHLALAAALEDGGNLQARYIIYMKLAEIHANYLPDVKLSQRYMDSARSLKRELAGHTDSSDTDDEYMNHVATGYAEAKSVSHSSDGSRSSDLSSTLVGAYMMDTSHTITVQKEAETEAVPTDYICREDMDTCSTGGTNCGPGQHTNSETSQINQRLHSSHTDSSLLCTEF